MIVAAVLFAAAMLAAASLAALWRGGPRERSAALVLTLAWSAGLAARTLLETHAPLLAVDALALAVLVALAWKSPSLWPVWAVGCQAVAVAASLTYALQPVEPAVYLRALDLADAGAALAVALGSFRRPMVSPL